MRRFDKTPLLVWMMAAALCSSGLALAQSSDAHPSGSAQKSGPLDSVPQPTAPTVSSTTVPKTPPTFEQVGDALMAHQRYQAAIEAYKKAPTNDPAVWN